MTSKKENEGAREARSVACADAPGREILTDAHEWVASNTGQSLSPLAKQVCDVLQFAGHGGIYNRPINWDRADLADPHCVSICWAGTLSNWDAPHLTAIWAHCAHKMLRVEICPASPRHIRLMFWQRRSRVGSMFERLPVALDQMAFVGAVCSESEDTQPKATPTQDDVDALVKAGQEFVKKVETGEARSKRSYAQFKAALTPFQKG